MFKITIEADSAEQLSARVILIANRLRSEEPAPALTEDPAPKAKGSPRKAATPEPSLAERLQPLADDVDRELLEDVEPAPATANSVVDAGTGKSVVPDFVEEPVKQMTFDDVKVAAAKLAQQDTPALKALIEKYGGTNLSSIPKDRLGDFAGEVLAAL